jgi:uncharacterized protein YhfF
LIFTTQMAKLIGAGRKSQTRRVVKPGETECRYKPGHSYALQVGRGKPATSRITVTEVRRERLGDIDLRDVKREGFRTTDDFRDYWRALHGRYDPDTTVWVISFQRGDHADRPRFLIAGAPQEAICRVMVTLSDGRKVPCGRSFGREFPDEPESCSLGHPKPGETDSDHGYTTNPARAMAGEGESPPASVLQRYAEHAAEKQKAKRAINADPVRKSIVTIEGELGVMRSTVTTKAQRALVRRMRNDAQKLACSLPTVLHSASASADSDPQGQAGAAVSSPAVASLDLDGEAA